MKSSRIRIESPSNIIKTFPSCSDRPIRGSYPIPSPFYRPSNLQRTLQRRPGLIRWSKTYILDPWTLHANDFDPVRAYRARITLFVRLRCLFVLSELIETAPLIGGYGLLFGKTLLCVFEIFIRLLVTNCSGGGYLESFSTLGNSQNRSTGSFSIYNVSGTETLNQTNTFNTVWYTAVGTRRDRV